MSKPLPKDKLLIAAEKLHFAASEQWNEFFNALKEEENEAVLALIRSPQDQLARMQGYAQMIQKIVFLLSKA